MVKAQAGAVLVVIFILGIIIEVYYVLSFLSNQRTLADILEKTFFTGVITAILIIIAIVLMRQEGIAKRMKSGNFSIRPKSKKQLSKELSRLYSDLGALKILVNDNLIEQKEYDKRKAFIDQEIRKVKTEMRTAVDPDSECRIVSQEKGKEKPDKPTSSKTTEKS